MKKKRIVKVISLIMCIAMCFPMVALAATGGQTGPGTADVNYTNISAHCCFLYISGLNSTSSATLYACRSMKLTIKMELQKIKSGTYSTIETWTDTTTGTCLLMEEDRLINVLATYRLKVTFTAGSETVVSYAYPD